VGKGLLGGLGSGLIAWSFRILHLARFRAHLLALRQHPDSLVLAFLHSLKRCEIFCRQQHGRYHSTPVEMVMSPLFIMIQVKLLIQQISTK
jgi:hypothetical protein